MVGTIGTRLLEMLHDEELTDVTFVVQGTEIKAHRVVASSQGGVLKEKLKNNAQRVDIGADVAPHTFKTVLQYLYTDECDISNENLFEVTHAAKILELPKLESFCSSYVEKKLTNTNVGGFTQQALLFECKDGVRVCQEYFRKYTSQILKTEEFLRISNEVLTTLCSSEGISCSEVELFSACVKWAHHECQRSGQGGTPEELRAALGDALSKIRFPCMTMDQFLKNVVPTEILPYDEVGQIIVGWQKKEQRTRYGDVHRTETIQVTVKGYSALDSTPTKELPLSTSIIDLKEMALWNGSKYPADQYTLSHKGKELSDEVTLGSIYIPGESLTLEVYSFSVYVEKRGMDGWKFPVTLRVSELQNATDVLKGHVYAMKHIQPQAMTSFGNIYHGHGGLFQYYVDTNKLTPGCNVTLH